MKIQRNDIETSEDKLEAALDKLVVAKDKLDAPKWMWVREEWNQWNVDLVACKASVKRLQKVVDKEQEIVRSCYED